MIKLKEINIFRKISMNYIFISIIFCSCFAFFFNLKIDNNEYISYFLGGWEAPNGIEFRIYFPDKLIACFLSFIAFFTFIFSGFFRKTAQYMAINILFLISFIGYLGMIISADLFNIYVFLEIASIATYSLLGYSNKRANFSAFEYLIIGSIAACFYLLGIGIIYMYTGSLNIFDILSRINFDNINIKIASLFIIIGFFIKFAAFPMHIWMRNCYIFADHRIVAFMSGISSKVFLYLLYKFSNNLFADLDINIALNFISILSLIYFSIRIFKNNNFKEFLVISSFININYILIIISYLPKELGTDFKILFIQIINHGFNKASLFLLSNNLDKYLKLSKWLNKISMAPIIIAIILLLSLAGFPLFPGFTSKFYLFSYLITKNAWISLFAISLASLAVFIKVINLINSLLPIILEREVKIGEIISIVGFTIILIITAIGEFLLVS